jgi:alkylhydroperoxidase/carboxymuconolactone decarboxylase family protein YurZ
MCSRTVFLSNFLQLCENNTMDNDRPPDIVQKFATEQPDVWNAYNQLGEAVKNAGPIDEKTQRLLKLALAVGSGREGAVRAHARRANRVGIPQVELEHVAALGITTLGWPAAFAARCWIQQALESENPPQ